MRRILNGLGDVYESEDSLLAEKEILICKESVKDAKKSDRPASRKLGKLLKLMGYSGFVLKLKAYHYCKCIYFKAYFAGTKDASIPQMLTDL